MSTRPAYKVVPTTADMVLEIAGWIGLVLLWAITIFYYPQLPSIIPVHFTLDGKVDSFGAKSTLLTLPTISTVIIVLITILNQHPHVFNYPTVINEQNAPAQYRNAVRMMRVVKVAIVVIFLVVLLHTISPATGANRAWASPWSFYAALLLLLLAIIYFVMKGLKTTAN